MNLPESWLTVTLGEVFRFRGGGTPDKKQTAYWNGEIPWASVKDVKGLLLSSTIDSITEKGLKASATSLAKPGDVIIVTRISPGETIIPTIEVAINQDLKVVTPEGGMPPIFIHYLFKSLSKTIIGKSSGTTVLGIRLNELGTIKCPLPPLNEQKRIVAKIEELFSELEAGEESLRQARRQLGVYRQSLLKQAFEGKLTAQWRKQNPDLLESPDQLLTRIQAEREKRYEEQVEVWEIAFDESKAKGEKKPPKPSILKPVKGEIAIFTAAFPSVWSSLNLSQIALELGQGWSPKCLNQAASSDEWGVMKTTAIQTGRFQAEASKILPPKLSPRPWLGLRHNDILITRAGSRSRCGVVCRVEGDHPKLLLCDKAYRLAFSEQATSSEFIELLLCSPVASDAIERLKTGINDSGVNITQKCFLQLVVPLPSLPEQQEIVRLLDEQFTVIEQNERELDAALKRSEALRQSILKKAFTGQLVPQDPTDEPATALLERIGKERAVAAIRPKRP